MFTSPALIRSLRVFLALLTKRLAASRNKQNGATKKVPKRHQKWRSDSRREREIRHSSGRVADLGGGGVLAQYG